MGRMVRDLETGDEGESIVMDLLRTANCLARKNDEVATRSHYDVIATLIHKIATGDGELETQEFTLEVKNDVYAKKSGNIALEVWNPKSEKLSGVSVTKADIWAQLARDEVWFAKTDHLKTFMGQQEPKRIVHKAGDGNAEIWLYDCDMILPSVFIRVDNLQPSEIHSAIIHLLNGV